ncbi:MAG: hypothetical protein IT384_20105 [Deltaproteobacteria bacterium]|nr:hypothetical protein [Deltaproteobacteria bacterium]
MSKLFESIALPFGGVARTRTVMAAMTRNFAGPGHTATGDMADYYGRRAEDGVGLVLSEGTIVDVSGDGYIDVPHITNEVQADSWRKVTNRVHRCGGLIFCQLWHCGRISHPDYTGGVAPVSSSEKAAEGVNRQNDKPYGKPRALGEDEMPSIYQLFARGARLALQAGFDGVELHLGHGYLADQFFDARINNRRDRYGGSVANRCRFGLELLERVLTEVGQERVMVRISPSREMNGVYDWPDLEEMVHYLVPRMSDLGLEMLDISCARADYFKTSGRIVRMVRPLWPKILIGGASLSLQQAEEELQAHLDMITWGRSILANPDFVSRSRRGEKLREFSREMLSSLE